jgi:hypothetical protein
MTWLLTNIARAHAACLACVKGGHAAPDPVLLQFTLLAPFEHVYTHVDGPSARQQVAI